MKKLISLILLAALLAFSGCKVGEILYETRTVDTGEVVQEDFTDAAGNLVPAGTPIVEEVHTLKPWVQNSLQSTGVIPIPGADIFGLVATGLLSIGGIWLSKKKRRADKVAESLVKGIDVFRDTLDRTEGGAILDQELTRILYDEQKSLQVLEEITALLQRYATPEKRTVDLKAKG